MTTTVIMPQLGESIAEGKIARWLKREGDLVARDESLVEVSTDKVNVEVPAPVSGTLAKILAPEGTVVPIKKEIAVIEEAGAAEKAPTAPAPGVKVPEAPAVHEMVGHPAIHEPAVGTRHYSPLVRRLAEQHGVDLSQIEGTGLGGRVTREDVVAAVEKHTGRPAAAPTPKEVPPPRAEEAARSAPPSAGPDEEIIPLTGMRKLIADHMVRSKRTAAHVTTITDVDMTEVVKLREAAKEAFHQKHGVKLTYMPFIIQATARALKEYPLLNSSLVEEKIIIKKRIHLGIAVSVESGLIVPVVKDADRLSIVELAKAVEDLAARARAGKLKPDDIHGGTFSITNPGVFGGLLSTPIIFQPQAAILGVQRISKMPVVINDAIAIRSMMYLCMSYDHRIVDGATSVQFLQLIRRTLEECKFSLEA